MLKDTNNRIGLTPRAPHICDMCEEAFDDEWLLIAHQELMHFTGSPDVVGNGKENYECSEEN